MSIRRRAFTFLVLVLAACGGDPEGPGAPAPEESSPRATLEAMKRASLDRDWAALYALCAPSERKEAEAKWDAARKAPEPGEGLAMLAESAGATPAEAAEMTLGELFAARNARQAERGGKAMEEAISGIEYLGTEAESEGGAVLMVRYRVAGNEQTMPMRREGDRWYLYMLLTALSDF